MKITAKLFSMFRYYAGVDEATVELERGATVADLLKKLADRFGAEMLAENKLLLMVMVNKKNASRHTLLFEGDVVHLMPILGGG